MSSNVYDISSPSFVKILNRLKKEFKDVIVDDYEFADLVLDIFERYSPLYKKDLNVTFDNFIESVLKKEIHNSIKQKLDDKDFSVINKFIENSFSGYESKNGFKLLSTLNKFFSKYNYTPDLDDCLRVIGENESLSDVIAKVVDNNLNVFRIRGLEDVCSDALSSTFISAYCMKNDISIEDFDEEEFDEKTSNNLNKKDSSDDYYGDDIVKAYLKDIGKFKLLTADEEHKYGVLLSQGDLVAREKFIESNLRLVVSVAKRYVNRGLPFLDLIQEGNLGLMKAIDKFDFTRGYKFSTYAIWWIRQSVTRAVHDKGRNVRIPVHLNEKQKRILEVVEKMENDTGQKPSYKQIAKVMNMKEDTIRALFETVSDTVSLNSFISDEEDTELGDFIPDSNQSTEGEALNNVLQDEVKMLLDKSGLAPREREIIERRFGLYDGYVYTLEECGQVFDITRERIRQIEAKALRKLRNSKDIIGYASYMDNPDEARDNIKKYRVEHYQKVSEKFDKAQDRRAQTSKPLERLDERNGLCFEGKIFTIDRIMDLLDEAEISSRDKKIIMKRFGLYNGKKYSLTELAIENKMSTQKVRQIELEVFSKFSEKEEPEVIEEIKSSKKNPKQAIIVDRKEDTVKQEKREVKDSSKERGKIMKEKKPVANIYTYFEGYTEEQIDSVLKGLPEKDLQVIHARYGEDLKNPTKLNKLDKQEYQRLYNGIFSKIRRRLEKSTQNNVSQNKKRIHRSLSSIYDYFFEYTEEQVNTMLAKLSTQDMAILQAKYGDNFKEPKEVRAWTDEEKKYMYNSLLVKMKNMLKKDYPEVKITEEIISEKKSKTEKKTVKKSNGSKKNQRDLSSVYKYFGEYTEEQVDVMLGRLSTDDINILKKRYGDDLKNPGELGVLDEKEYAYFYKSILIKMCRMLSRKYPGVSPKLDKVYGVAQGEEKRKYRSMKSIYIYFDEYTEEQVDYMLTQLPEKYMTVLHNKYGDDLKHPQLQTINDQENILFRGAMKRKMLRILQEKYPEVEKRSEEIANEDAVKESKPNMVEEMITLEETAEDALVVADELVEETVEEKVVEEVQGEDGDDKELSITELVIQDEKQAEQEAMLDEQIIDDEYEQGELPLATEDKKDSITKEAYVEILEMLRTPTFGQLMTTLGPKDAVIISLRLGYVDGKCFSTESISDFLGISKEEVIDRTKGVLTMYRDNFNDFIDKAIEVTCEKPIQYVKKEEQN